MKNGKFNIPNKKYSGKAYNKFGEAEETISELEDKHLEISDKRERRKKLRN